MRLKNTTYSYGFIAKFLHWLIALLFLASYGSVYYRRWFTEEGTPENWTVLQLHLSFGTTIAVLVLLRIIWRLLNPQPALEPGPAWAHMASRLGHYTLYAVMIMMPVTGYIGTGADTEFFSLGKITKFENTSVFNWLVTEKLEMSFKEFEKPVDFIHKNIGGAWLVWILILGHASAAMYHHFVRKDRTLSKMLPEKS